MERGLFYQPGPLTLARFEALVREVSLAESLGLRSVWCLPTIGEDGGFQGGAPSIWLAGLAGTTRDIRLGWGVPGLWPPGEPPVREAEQGATLDGACGGRLDVAVLPDLGAAAEACAAGPVDEGVRMFVEMWAPATFSWTSPRFSMPPIDVVPKPLQRPHPPLWLVGWSASHAFEAGRAGLGFFDVSGGGFEVWEASRDCYVAGRAESRADELVCEAVFAVGVDWPADPEAGTGTRRGPRGEASPEGEAAARDLMAGLEAIGLDHVLLRGSTLEDDHEQTCRRIRWFADSWR